MSTELNASIDSLSTTSAVAAGNVKNRHVGTLVYTTGGLVTLFAWLLMGDFAIAMRERGTLPSAMELLRQYHASATMVSILTATFPAIIGLFLVPIVSVKSDQFRSRLGRRIPFLIFSTPIGALAMVGLGFSPWLGEYFHQFLGKSSPGLDYCVLGFFCFFWAIFECVAVLTLALFSALINDVVPSGLLGRFYGCFRIVGLAAGIIFNLYIFKMTETHLMEIFVAIGLFFGIAFTLMCLVVKEGKYDLPLPSKNHTLDASGFTHGIKSYLAECFSQRYYRWAFAAIAIGTIAPNPFFMFYQWYAGSLGMPKETLGNLLAYSYGTSICLAYFIGWFVDKFNALRVATFALLIYMALMLAGYFWVKDVSSFSYFFVANNVLSGVYFTAAASLPMMLLPRMKFSQYASAAGIVTGSSMVVLSFVVGLLLDFSGKDYSLTILASGILSALAALVGFYLMTIPKPERDDGLLLKNGT